jgi:kynurenine formamidase
MNTRVVDLTRTLTPGFPTSIADVPPVRRWPATTYESHGFSANGWSLVEHIGTHVDAPVHFVPGGKEVDAIPADELVLPARVVHLPSAQLVTVADLLVEERRHGPIPTRSAVLLCCGWGTQEPDVLSYLGWDGTAYRAPGWSAEAVEWLVENRAIIALGTDTSSIDAGDASAAHQTLLGAGRYAIEGLVNLDQLVGYSSFTLVVGVIPWESGTGGPCRALALVAPAEETP